MTSYFGYDPDALEHSCYDLFLHKGSVPADLPGQLLPTSNRVFRCCRRAPPWPPWSQSPGQSGLGLVIAKTLAQLWQDFDYAIIDSPPLLGVLMVNALAASQQLDPGADRAPGGRAGLERMVSTLAMINRSRKQALPFSIVPTLFDRRTQASLGTLRVLRDAYPDTIWNGYIPVDTRLRDASRAGLTPSQFDGKSRGVLAYRALLSTCCPQQLVAQVA